MPSTAVKEKDSIVTEKMPQNPLSVEVVVFCPSCKAFQTIWLDGETLMPTRKFTQESGRIYHDCGSSEPCRLIHKW